MGGGWGRGRSPFRGQRADGDNRSLLHPFFNQFLGGQQVFRLVDLPFAQHHLCRRELVIRFTDADRLHLDNLVGLRIDVGSEPFRVFRQFDLQAFQRFDQRLGIVRVADFFDGLRIA